MSDLISRAEAKEALRERFKRIPTYAIWAMHTIDELPTHTTPSNTLGALDCVERQKAIDESYQVVIDGDVFDVVQVETLMGLPSVQPKKGHITYTEFCEELWGQSSICSLCGCSWQIADDGNDNFCPNCGFRMEEGDSND